MPFPESLAREVKRRCHFQCCLCKALGVELHHIVPQAEGGKDTEANAAPLCPSCHETYGANSVKRKFIREARDSWYEVCEKRYAPDSSLLAKVHAAVEQSASKTDLAALRNDIGDVIERLTSTVSARTLKIPRKQHKRSSNRRLDIRDLWILILGHPADRPLSQTELLCTKELWPVKDGLRTVRKDFLSRFGERTLRLLAAKVLDEENIEATLGLTEDEIVRALKIMAVEAVLLLEVDSGYVVADLEDNGQIRWKSIQYDDP